MAPGRRIQAREQWVALGAAGVAFALAFVILWVAGLPGVNTESSAIGMMLPSFTGQTGTGELITSDDLHGGPVLVNFWATWCAPCQMELPDLQRLYEAQSDGGLRVVAVNVNESPEVFLPWAAARGLTFDLVADVDADIQHVFQVRGTPQTFVIDAQGVIREIFYGPVTLPRLERALATLEGTQNEP